MEDSKKDRRAIYAISISRALLVCPQRVRKQPRIGALVLVETLTHTPHKHAVGAEFVECKVSTYTGDTFTCGHMRGTRVRACVRAYVLGGRSTGRSVNVNCVRLIENRWYAWSATKAISATTMRAENTHGVYAYPRPFRRMQYTLTCSRGRRGGKKGPRKVLA